MSPNPQITMTGLGSGSVVVTDPTGNATLITVNGPVFSTAVALAPGFNVIQGAVAAVTNLPPGVDISFPADPLRRRRVLFLPGTVPVFTFGCTFTPAAPTVATERTLTLAATITGTTQTAHTWEVDGAPDSGSITPAGVYRAPCEVPASGAATVRVRSAFDPSRTAAVNVTILPGIAVAATAASGTPADTNRPSANVGQSIQLRIPAGTLNVTTERFAPAQPVVFKTRSRDAAGGCVDGETAVAGTVATGLASMTVAVPACAAPEQHLRVAGFGCAQLQVVPRILSLNRAASLGSSMGINGSGFVCGATRVFFGATEVPAAQLLSVECNVILVGTRPAAGQAVTVRTAGGTSNAMS